MARRAKRLAIKEHGPPKAGHDPNQGRRKTARPWAKGLPLYVVVRSTTARGTRSMAAAAHRTWVSRSVHDHARARRVKIVKFANHGSELHFVLLAPSPEALRGFMRGIAGKIAMRISGARKGNAARKPFFDGIPYSRIIQKGESVRDVCGDAFDR